MSRQYTIVCKKCKTKFKSNTKNVTFCRNCQLAMLENMGKVEGRTVYNPYFTQEKVRFSMPSLQKNVCTVCHKPFETAHPNVQVCINCQTRISKLQVDEEDATLHELTVSQKSKGTMADEVQASSKLVRKQIRRFFPHIRVPKD